MGPPGAAGPHDVTDGVAPNGVPAPLAAARPLRADDYARARAVVDDWFGHPVGLVMHRLFFDQLGPWGVWLEDAHGRPAGFLLGLVSQAEPDLAYVHMHVVDPRLRGRGVGELLYREFCARAAAGGCRRVRALAAPERRASQRFHERLGFVGTDAPAYLGPDGDRIVYERPLPLDPAAGPQAQAGDDRRAHVRHRVTLPVRVSTGDVTSAGRSVDLSEGGILIVGVDLPPTARVSVEVELADLGWHAFDATVVRRGHDGDGRTSLAASFAAVAADGSRDAIRRFLRERMA